MRQHILEFLSPISLPHGTHLLAAFAVAWNDRRQRASASAASSKKVSLFVSFLVPDALLICPVKMVMMVFLVNSEGDVSGDW